MNRQMVPGFVAQRGPAILLTASVALLGLIGCDSVDPTTHAVKGKVEYVGGDVKQLAGAHVEAVLINDRRIEASGEIQWDGTFTLATPYDGRILEGVREGDYEVRIVVSDDDAGSRQRPKPRLATRFKRYNQSGLLLAVPKDGPVLLRVSPR